jgi:hypothetical protein
VQLGGGAIAGSSVELELGSPRHVVAVLGEDALEQALPGPEVVVERRLVPLAGQLVDVTKLDPVDALGGEELLARTDQEGPSRCAIAAHAGLLYF